MKRLISLFAVLFILIPSAYPAPFSPTVLKLSAPSVLRYDFSGNTLSLPVVVTGTPANVTFLVFTNGKAASIRKVRNGYLGWHYVSNIDTCLYISAPFQFQPGANTVVWNGRDENGIHIPSGDYTYYLWGYDNVSPRTLMTRQMQFNPWIYRTIVTHDTDGMPSAQPMLYLGGGIMSTASDPVTQTHSKWIVGSDPEDVTLRETTTSPGWWGVGGIALQPDDYRNYFYTTLKAYDVEITEKYEWVPNGVSVLQTGWGKDGRCVSPIDQTSGLAGPGVVSDGGDYLFLASADVWGSKSSSQLIFLDVHTGAEIRRLDLSPWWVSSQDQQNGGQASGGPTTLSFRDGLLALGCHASCLNQLMDPYVENFQDALVWSNGNGDYTGDHNYEPESNHKWVCNDYNTGPYKYNISMDANHFTAFPSYNFVFPFSFGLYAPDGTGMGYRAVANENSKGKWGIEFIDYGSAYDGIYTTNSDIPGEGGPSIDPSFWFIAHDSIKGTISASGTGVWLVSPRGGEIWKSGTAHSITWQTSDMNKAKIEYSADGGHSWKLITDNVNAESGTYSWTPEGIHSTQCLVRISSANDPSLWSVSSAVFTIMPSTVSVIAPNRGEKWPARSVRNIVWSAYGFEFVKIEYSPDNGASWAVIAQKVDASLQKFSWTLPDSASDICLVRVSSVSEPLLSDSSDGVFTISPSFLRLTAPNGGERYTAEENVPITWEAAGIVNSIRIDYSPNNGEKWIPAAAYVSASDTEYIWQIPYFNSTSFLVRVSDEGSSGLFDTSDTVFSVSSPLSVSERIPREFAVSPNSPNPFNPSTTISFSLPKAERVKVDIYNLSGQKVGTVLDGPLEPGRHSVVWNANGLSAGVYLGLVRAGAEVKTVKMLLLK